MTAFNEFYDLLQEISLGSEEYWIQRMHEKDALC